VSGKLAMPKPLDIDVIFFGKGLGVEVALLRALSVDVVELLELAI
jgi:hypothetical protein